MSIVPTFQPACSQTPTFPSWHNLVDDRIEILSVITWPPLQRKPAPALTKPAAGCWRYEWSGLLLQLRGRSFLVMLQNGVVGTRQASSLMVFHCPEGCCPVRSRRQTCEEAKQVGKMRQEAQSPSHLTCARKGGHLVRLQDGLVGGQQSFSLELFLPDQLLLTPQVLQLPLVLLGHISSAHNNSLCHRWSCLMRRSCMLFGKSAPRACGTCLRRDEQHSRAHWRCWGYDDDAALG